MRKSAIPSPRTRSACPFNSILQDFHRALRQRAHEGATIRFCHDSIIKNDDDAVIAFRPNEAAHPLSQLQDRFRERIFRESIATRCFDAFQFCFNQRIIRHGERQPRDNDIAQRVTGDIDAAPETVGPKKYAAAAYS